ncbi:MAG: rRNA maturation RNase YbeY [Acidobacteria bacterium]|nr:rRNA maturation RNase YbeY [Acidobacteriota bacterium]
MSEEGSTILFERCAPLDRRRLRAFHRRLQVEIAGAYFNRFLGQDEPTDVLSFPSGTGGALPGEIAISAGRAAVQARKFGHSLETEIEILMLHGALHLEGMDHETDGGEMGRAEHALRRKFGLPTGLIRRARRRR